VVVAGCGGGGGGNSAATQEQLKIAQARADVNEFCAVSGSTGAVYDLAYFNVLDAVDTLSTAWTKHRSEKVNLDQRNHGVPVEKVVRDSAAQLAKNCGKDGKLEAAQLKKVLQQQ
jgi:hypothetical protein